VNAAAPGRAGDQRIAEEQAALRRVAVLVARAAPPDEVFAAIAQEAGQLLGAGHATLSRYDPDGTASAVATWSSAGAAVPIGTRVTLGGYNVHTLVFQTGEEVRLDDYGAVSGAMARLVGELGLREAVGAPVSVEGRLWGVMVVASTDEWPLPADTEARLAGFTELAATAIANAQARTELRGFADEQAALRRVATLVARGAPPGEVFGAVAEEAGRLLGADVTGISRYDPDGMAAAIGGWARVAGPPGFPVGTSVPLGGRNVVTLVSETGRPARIDHVADSSGEPAAHARERGFGSGRYRGAAGRVCRTGRHRHRQRAGPHGTEPLCRGAGGAGPGGDAGGPGRTATGGIHGGHRRGRAATSGRLHGLEPV
jgi:GAF domain-containing protein